MLAPARRPARSARRCASSSSSSTSTRGTPATRGTSSATTWRAGGHDFRMIAEDTYSIVTEKIPEGKTYCSLCSRLRRGILYRARARARLHQDRARPPPRRRRSPRCCSTCSSPGQLKAMPPKLVSRRRATTWSSARSSTAPRTTSPPSPRSRRFPILPCDLCGSQENLQRKAVSRLLAELDERCPGARRNMLAALGNVRPSHLLDKGLWKKLGLEVAREAEGAARRLDAPATAEHPRRRPAPPAHGVAHGGGRGRGGAGRGDGRGPDGGRRASLRPSRLAVELREGRTPPTLAAVADRLGAHPRALGVRPGGVLAHRPGLAWPPWGPGSAERCVARAKPRMGRHLGISLFAALATATWLVRRPRHPPAAARPDPRRPRGDGLGRLRALLERALGLAGRARARRPGRAAAPAPDGAPGRWRRRSRRWAWPPALALPGARLPGARSGSRPRLAGGRAGLRGGGGHAPRASSPPRGASSGRPSGAG